jgi:hypothetical protein
MAHKRPSTIPTLPELIRRTPKLRRDLASLAQEFPEDHLEPGERIFGIRFMTTRWRNLVGEEAGPYDAKKGRAVRWIDQYLEYIRDLEACIAGGMGKPEGFERLPLHGLAQLSAEEYIRALDLQQAALKRIHADEIPASGRGDHAGALRERLRSAAKTTGVAEIAFKTGLNRDTVEDFIHGRVKKPRKATAEKLERFAEDMEIRSSSGRKSKR